MFFKLIWNHIISNFVTNKIVGIKCIDKDIKYFDVESFSILISVLLWMREENSKMENADVIIEISDSGTAIIIFQLINPIIIKISLIRLIVGGAEILTAVNINHQNVILGKELISPLNDIIFRVWYFV